MSHYIAPFTREDRWGRAETVCGTYITMREFSTTPDCPRCAAWLVEDDASFGALSVPHDRDDPLMQPVTPPDYGDITGGRPRR